MVDYKLSELRVIELLDGLCNRVSSYALWKPSDEWAAQNPEEDAERQWVKISGAGAHAGAAAGA